MLRVALPSGELLPRFLERPIWEYKETFIVLGIRAFIFRRSINIPKLPMLFADGAIDKEIC